MTIQPINKVQNNIQSALRLQLSNTQTVQTPLNAASVNQNTSDAFEKSNKKQLSSGTKAGIILCALGIAAGAILSFKSGKTQEIGDVVKKTAEELDFREKLAKGLSEHLGKKVESKSLSCVLNKDELLDIISNLKKENYVLTPENMERGIFRADLHSHSNFSDGSGSVRELLDEAASYGDKLFEKTKAKFTYALTDHDGVDGVIEALTYISENPQKFDNINFVPGAELSYAHIAPKSANPTETSEVLAYCINPFDKKIQSYFSNLHLKRRNTIKNTIEELNLMFPKTEFSVDEFEKIYGINLNRDMYRMNLHWKIHHYGQTKLAISDIAKKSGQNPTDFYSEIMSKVGRNKALGNLKDKGLIPGDINENPDIIKLREKIQPKINPDRSINTQSESTIEEITSAFLDDKETVFALAHPYYLTERLYDPIEFVKSIIDKFKSKLIGTESYHQAYSPSISKEGIENINSNLEALGLKALGGRDNHMAKLF